MKQRTTALTSSQVLDRLYDLLIPKLKERLKERLPTPHGAVGSGSLIAWRQGVWGRMSMVDTKPFMLPPARHSISVYKLQVIRIPV